MWITTREFERIKREYEIHYEQERAILTAECVRLRDELSASEAMLIREQSNVDWLRHRLTQLELERAQLLAKVTGINVPTPIFARENEGLSEQGLMNALSSLDIVGKDVDDADVS